MLFDSCQKKSSVTLKLMKYLTLFIIWLDICTCHNSTILPCPPGFYRTIPSLRECKPCPRGVYGDSYGLVSEGCTAQCPAGRYNDMLGAKSIDDCKLCPPGTFGATSGQITPKCTGTCPAGKYSSTPGLSVETGCINCPKGYYSWQCANYKGFDIPPRIPRQD